MKRQMTEEQARLELLMACRDFANALEHYDEVLRVEQKWKDLAAKGSIQTRKARNLQNRNFRIGY